MKRICLVSILLIVQNLHAKTPDSLSAPQTGFILPHYFHMTGQIDGKYDITMDMLVARWQAKSDEIVVNGSYYYNTIKEPIMFFWGRYKGDQMHITPRSDDVSESFTGQFDGTAFKGVWTSTSAVAGSKVRKLPFVLRKDTSDGIKLAMHLFVDSFIAYKKLANSPAVFYQHELLLPDSGENQKLAQVFYGIYGRADSYDAMARSIRNESRKYISDFKKYDMKYGSKSDPEYPCWKYSCRYYITYDTRILYNSKELLSFRYTRYSNEGMNHGYARPDYYSYSVAQQRLVRLSDIVSLSDTPMLKMILDRHLRKLYHLYPGGNDSSDGAEPLPADFYVMPGGIAFIHPALLDHVEPFAVFIPFTEIGDKLRKQPWME